MDFTIIQNKFFELFNTTPLVVRSPGRINLIGEHTDYNEGFVLPAAIDKQMIVAVAKNNLGRCRLYSYDYAQLEQTPISEIQPSETSWANYILGVVDQLQKAGHRIGGFDCIFGGDIPMGAGLSSSAALECGAAYALIQLFELEVDKVSLVKLAQKAEHTFAGVQCGIMDQFASVMGKSGHAIRLDCRSLAFSYFPLNLKNYQLILCDTQVKHSLASSEYNTRRKECEEGVSVVNARYPEVESLRDVSHEMLEEIKEKLRPVVYKRCRFIVEENERLLSGCELLEKGDISGFGQKMYGSHEGLRNQYEVSCPELDFLVDFTLDKPAVEGARMMGGGFGGCTLNLVHSNHQEDFIREISGAYKERFQRELQAYLVNISEGTSSLTNEKE